MTQMDNPLHQCPCCDYFTLEKRNDWEICLVCFWEDDGVDIENPDKFSAPNQMTLREGRQNFLKLGACEEEMLENVLNKQDRKAYKLKKRIV